MAAPEPRAIYKSQEKEIIRIKGKENINNNNCSIVNPEIGNPKISDKTLEIFNKSFKKKKTKGKFFKIKKNNIKANFNHLKSNINNENINKNNNPLNTSRNNEDEKFKLLLFLLIFSLFIFN